MANVDIILTEKIEKLGAEADVVSVKSGYANNFLIPQGKALVASRGNLRQLEALKALRAEREAKELADAEKTATKIKKLKLDMELATGQGGKAFGSITTIDIAKAVKERTGIDLDRHNLDLDKPIKGTGRFDIPVKLHSDVKVTLKVNVHTADEGEEKEES